MSLLSYKLLHVKPISQNSSTELEKIERVINAGSPPAPTAEIPLSKEIKFQMVIPPELCQAFDSARKLTKTSRRAWLLQAAPEKLEREGKL